jgi:hypothetical protein
MQRDVMQRDAMQRNKSSILLSQLPRQLPAW